MGIMAIFIVALVGCGVFAWLYSARQQEHYGAASVVCGLVALLAGMIIVVILLATGGLPASYLASYETLRNAPNDLRAATVLSDIESFNGQLAEYRYWQRHWLVNVLVPDVPDTVQAVTLTK